MSAGHDTTGRPDPDRARDAAVVTMLTGEASGASPKPLDDDVLAIIAAAEEQRDATLSVALDDSGLTCSVSSEVRAAIKAHRDIMIDTRMRSDGTDEEFDRDAQAQIDAEYAVAHVPVRSLADVRAKLTYLVPLMAPDMLDQTHVAHLEAIRDDVVYSRPRRERGCLLKWHRLKLDQDIARRHGLAIERMLLAEDVAELI